MPQGTEDGLQPTASKKPSPLRELNPANNHLSLEANPSLLEPSNETLAQANNLSAAL